MWRTGISFRAATAFFPQGQWEEFLCFPQPVGGGFSREILHRISFHIPQPLWKEKSVKKMLHFDETACRRCHVPPAGVFLVLTRNTRKKQPEGDCVVAFPRAKAIAPLWIPLGTRSCLLVQCFGAVANFLRLRRFGAAAMEHPLAPPLGELSPKVTERALLYPLRPRLRAATSPRGRGKRVRYVMAAALRA